MDLTLSPAEAGFRDEIRAWLEEHHPGPEPGEIENAFDFRVKWQRTLHRAGYAGISWPEAYGGRGASLMEQAIFNEEMVRARAPFPANILGLVMGGPVVIKHGTEDQKRRFLEPILSAEEIWCQGFSEPDAGSDLASLRTRAEKVEGGYRVTGQKVWTSYAHRARWCMLVSRTADGPRYRDLTYAICDMRQDGVEVRPLRQATGESEFNEVFFDSAFIPDENVIGAPGDGWNVAITTLSFERAGLSAASALGIKLALGDLAQLIRHRGHERDPVIRQRFGQLVAASETLRLTGHRGLSRIIERGIPGPEGSIDKIQWAEVNQGLGELAVDVLGSAVLEEDEVWTHRLIRARANSIEGGTTEVQKNILAERVLGLPRMR